MPRTALLSQRTEKEAMASTDPPGDTYASKHILCTSAALKLITQANCTPSTHHLNEVCQVQPCYCIRPRRLCRCFTRRRFCAGTLDLKLKSAAPHLHVVIEGVRLVLRRDRSRAARALRKGSRMQGLSLKPRRTGLHQQPKVRRTFA